MLNKEKDFLGVGIHIPNLFPNLNNTVEPEILTWSFYEKSIEDSILIILTTSPGQRVMRPDFGCPLDRFVFEPYNKYTKEQIDFCVKESLRQWEPRIEVEKVEITNPPNFPNILNIEIYYKVIATNNSFNLVYPFKIETAK